MKNKKGFYWGIVTLTYNAETKHETKALIYGDSGLCINQFNPREPEGKFICVSHIKSGKRLTDGFYTHQSARWFCEAVSGLVDWTQEENVILVNRSKLGPEVKAIRGIVAEHKAKWRVALVAWKLNGGLTE